MSKKIITAILSTLVLLSIPPVSVQAAPSILPATSSPHKIQPRENQTDYKYKTINGKLYKRLWSYTYLRWEEPYWTPV